MLAPCSDRLVIQGSLKSKCNPKFLWYNVFGLVSIMPQFASIALQHFIVVPEQANQRLDNFLLTRLKGLPKSCLYRLLRQGKIRVNQKRSKPAYRLQINDSVKVPSLKLTPPLQIQQPSLSLQTLLEKSILFEDSNLIVINKPYGIAVHGGSGINLGVIEAMRQLRPTQRYLELAHRLDKDTSGCLLIAKKPAFLRHLHALLRESNHIEKTYLTLVAGHWPSTLQSVNLPLRKNQLSSGERIVKIDQNGKSSLTKFRVLEYFQHSTLLEAQLCTGRTHQIRVHTQQALHPIAGDEKYGNKLFNQSLRKLGLKRLFLHAHQVRFALPVTNQPICVQAALPYDLQAVLQQPI